MTIDMTKIDDKDAVLSMKLKADSGYSAEETHRVSARQWGDIVAIANNTPRTASIPNAAYVAGIEAALQEIGNRHIPDQPAAYGGNELEWAIRQHTELRRIARAALASRHASSDVRVVTVDQLEYWADVTQSGLVENEIRAIIGGQP